MNQPPPPSASPPATTPHSRECMSCGFDIVGLNPAGVCPECGTSLRDTLKHTLLRELGTARARRVAISLRVLAGGFASIVGAIVISILMAMLDSVMHGARGISQGLILLIALVFGPLGYIAGTLALFWNAPTSAWRRALGGISLLAVLACGVGLWVIAEFMQNDRGQIFVGVTCLVCALSMALHLFTLADTLNALAPMLGRKGLDRRARRWRRITIVWHVWIVLPVVLILSLGIVLEAGEHSRSIQSIGAPFILAWFCSWIGHGIWIIGMCVVTVQLSRGAWNEVRLASGTRPSEPYNPA